MSTELENTQNETLDLNELAAAQAERDAMRKVAVKSAVRAAIAGAGFQNSKSAEETVMARVDWNNATGTVTSHDGTKSVDDVIKGVIGEAEAYLKAGQKPESEPLVSKGQIVLSRDDFGNDAKAKSEFISKYGGRAWEALPQHAPRDSGVVESVDDLKSTASKKLFIEKYGYARYEEIVAAGAEKRRK